MKAEKIIRLRMQNSIFCRRIPVVQGDTARTFRFILEDITLDGTEHARIYARKPSGAEVYDECEVVGSNEVIFTPETEQIFIETGIILAEIRVAKGEKLITSYSFEFEVRQSTMRTGDIPSSDEFNALERAIEEAKDLHEPEFTEAGKRENIVSGETMQILFGKIKKWFTDLGALITKIGNKDISSIGDGTVTGAITDLDKRSTKNTSDIDVERKRIDNIAKLPEGSTAGDAELADIRVAADGTVYDTAGESVRGQINQIDQKYEKETGSLKEEKVENPLTGVVGQILEIETVDESGKPKTYKAVNKPSGGGEVTDEQISNAVDNYMTAHPFTETDPTVPDWAKHPEKPRYTAEEVGADASGTAESKVSEHNVSDTAHNDIRLLIDGLTTRLNALADSDDTTFDQMSEVVAYIKSNKSLIDAITTSKVNVSDIIDNLTTNASNKPLSAAQGVALKTMIDRITIPTTLPNPNALTFTGAVTGSYDGSSPIEINIPGGGGTDVAVDTTLSVVGQAADAKATGDAISQLSDEIVDLQSGGLLNMADAVAPPNQLAADGSTFGDYNAETEELYTGVGCNQGSDFNGENVMYSDICDYIDKVRANHPQYVWRETLGLDASDTYTIYRYVMSQCYYRAWQRENYPKMFAWVNGSTTIYSLSVSPRIGDTLYTTVYIGTAKGTVTAVNNANQTRTVGGVIYTRDKTKDVELTLLFTDPSCLAYVNGNTRMVDANKTTITTLINQEQAIKNEASTDGVAYAKKLNEVIYNGSLVADNGYTYIRYPLGDRFYDMSEPIKVVVGCNEHGNPGDPPEPAMCCARLIKDLAENTDNRMLNYLREKTMVIAIPVINPWGFNQRGGDGYRNFNGININRNYDTVGWHADADTGPSGDYGGSENETQYFMNTVCLADVATSYHGMGVNGTSQQQICTYQFNGYLTQNPNSQTTPSEVGEKNVQIGAVMLKHFGWSYVYYNEASPSTTAKSPSYITQAGCTGGLIEMCASQGASGEDEYGLHTALVMQANYSLMLMTLYSFIHDFDKTIRI